jgi:hypothetical protein
MGGMNISSIGGAAGSNGVGGANQTDFRTRMQEAMAPVAQLFGMSTDQLMSAVKASGGTLADYAASKGISNADLTTALKQGLQSNAPNGTQLSDTQLTNLVQRIENHKPRHGSHGSASSTAVSSATSTDTTSTIKSELEKLIADLKASAGSSASASSGSTNALLDVLTRFDQQL